MSKVISEEYNEFTGTTIRYLANPDGSITVQQFQDIEEQLVANRQEFKEHSSKGRHNFREGLGRKVASIPSTLVPQIKKEQGIDIITCSNADLRKFLNNSDYSAVRTSPGTL